MGKGRHKGGARRFTDFAAEEQKAEKIKVEQEWRRKRGELESEEEEEDDEKKKESGSESSEESDSEEESEEEEEEEKVVKPKGIEGLIDFENPNHQVRTTKKASEIDLSKAKAPQLTRRQKEEVAKQNYDSMHAACKTEQARSDLERLALIRKKRDDADKKKKEATETAAAAAASKVGSREGGKGARSKR